MATAPKKRRLPQPAKIMPPEPGDAATTTSPSAEDEDILDRFSDPTKKRKRKEKKDEKEEERKAKMVNAGKRFAVDEFNTPPSAEDLATWQKFVEPPLPTLLDLEHLQKAAEAMTIDAIGYTSLAKTEGFFAVMDCLNAMVHCSTWLKDRLSRLGWKINMTGYEPTAVSHSTREILPATLECYRMAIKQMIWLATPPPSSPPQNPPPTTSATTSDPPPPPATSPSPTQ